MRVLHTPNGTKEKNESSYENIHIHLYINIVKETEMNDKPHKQHRMRIKKN